MACGVKIKILESVLEINQDVWRFFLTTNKHRRNEKIIPLEIRLLLAVVLHAFN